MDVSLCVEYSRDLSLAGSSCFVLDTTKENTAFRVATVSSSSGILVLHKLLCAQIAA